MILTDTLQFHTIKTSVLSLFQEKSFDYNLLEYYQHWQYLVSIIILTIWICWQWFLSRCYFDRIHGYVINGENIFWKCFNAREIVLFSSYQCRNLINKEIYGPLNFTLLLNWRIASWHFKFWNIWDLQIYNSAPSNLWLYHNNKTIHNIKS